MESVLWCQTPARPTSGTHRALPPPRPVSDDDLALSAQAAGVRCTLLPAAHSLTVQPLARDRAEWTAAALRPAKHCLRERLGGALNLSRTWCEEVRSKVHGAFHLQHRCLFTGCNLPCATHRHADYHLLNRQRPTHIKTFCKGFVPPTYSTPGARTCFTNTWPSWGLPRSCSVAATSPGWAETKYSRTAAAHAALYACHIEMTRSPWRSRGHPFSRALACSGTAGWTLRAPSAAHFGRSKSVHSYLGHPIPGAASEQHHALSIAVCWGWMRFPTAQMSSAHDLSTWDEAYHLDLQRDRPGTQQSFCSLHDAHHQN